MASYYSFSHMPTQPAPVSHNHHAGRSRRTPRLSVSQNTQRQFRGVRGIKDFNESTGLSVFRSKFEAVRSFDLEDDLEFCPGLLTENDVSSDPWSDFSPAHFDKSPQLVSFSYSERSSLASNSPTSSPTQQPQFVAPGFSLNSASPSFVPPTFQNQQPNFKMPQPSIPRGRNAIPIINPVTGISMPSPTPSVSPARMQQAMGRRW